MTKAIDRKGWWKLIGIWTLMAITAGGVAAGCYWLIVEFGS